MEEGGGGGFTFDTEQREQVDTAQRCHGIASLQQGRRGGSGVAGELPRVPQELGGVHEWLQQRHLRDELRQVQFLLARLPIPPDAHLHATKVGLQWSDTE